MQKLLTRSGQKILGKKDGTKIKMIIQNVYDAQYIQNQG